MARNEIAQTSIKVEMDVAGAVKSTNQLEAANKSLEKQLKRDNAAVSRLEAEQQQLNKAYRTGAISQRQYEAIAVKQARTAKRLGLEYRSQAAEIKKVASEQSRLNKIRSAAGTVGRGVAGFGAGVLGGAYLIQGAVGELQEQVNRELRIRSDADLLGFDVDKLNRLAWAIGQLTGRDTDTVIDSLMDFKERIGEASVEIDSALGQSAKAIGLDVQRLKDMGIEDALKATVNQLGKLKTEEEQLFRARELFGDEAARMFSSALEDADKLRALQEEARGIQFTMTDKQLEESRELAKEASKATKEVEHLKREIGSFAVSIAKSSGLLGLLERSNKNTTQRSRAADNREQLKALGIQDPSQRTRDAISKSLSDYDRKALGDMQVGALGNPLGMYTAAASLKTVSMKRAFPDMEATRYNDMILNQQENILKAEEERLATLKEIARVEKMSGLSHGSDFRITYDEKGRPVGSEMITPELPALKSTKPYLSGEDPLMSWAPRSVEQEIDPFVKAIKTAADALNSDFAKSIVDQAKELHRELTQQYRVDEVQGQIDDLNRQRLDEQAAADALSVSIDEREQRRLRMAQLADAPSFSGGSVEEYKFIRSLSLNRQQGSEESRIASEARADRKANTDRLEAALNKISDMEEQMNEKLEQLINLQ
jgi:hypothetical protein